MIEFVESISATSLAKMYEEISGQEDVAYFQNEKKSVRVSRVASNFHNSIIFRLIFIKTQ